MLLRKLFIIFFLGLVFAVLAYFYTDLNTPFELDKLQEYAIENDVEEENFEKLDILILELIDKGLILNYVSVNFYVGFALILMAVNCFFIDLHLIVEKLFFREFYENPSLKLAIRRSIALTVGLSTGLYLKLSGGSFIESLLPLILIILLEIFYINMTKKVSSQ